MRLSWRNGNRRKRAARRSGVAPTLRVRQLERRRVLDAGAAGLVLGPTLDTSLLAASGVSDAPLVFDWSAIGSDSSASTSGADQAIGATDNPAADPLQSSQRANQSLMMLANVPPVLVVAVDQTVDEGALLDLSGVGAPPLGLFVDTDLGDMHSATVNWGDGSATESAMVFSGVGSGALGGVHTYSDNGTFEVTVTLTDSSGASDSEKFTVTVNNVAPTAALGNSGPVVEGSSAIVAFSGQVDPSTVDTLAGFRYAYDFDNDGIFDIGDGTYAGSVATSSQLVDASYFSEGPASHTVLARIIDKDGGFNDYTTDIIVQNAAPTLINIAGDAIDEGEIATIAVTIDDPSPSDEFTVNVNWLDGSTATITGLGAIDASGTVGTTDFSWTAATRRLELSHRYLDDGPGPMDGNPSFVYAVEVSAVDDDMGVSPTVIANVIVNNRRPVLVVAGDQMVDEGQVLDLSGIGAPPLGLFVDDGVLDTHTAIVDWGDGTIENATVFAFMGSGSIGGTHVYTDDGLYTVTVTVLDDDGGVSTPQSFQVMVKNVPPKIDLSGAAEVDEGSAYTLSLGPVVDPGADTVSQYIIHWGDGVTESFTAADVASGTLSHTYADGLNNYEISIDLVDEDGTYLAVDTLPVTVNNVAPTLTLSGPSSIDEGSLYTLNLASFDPGADTITEWTIDWGDNVEVVSGNPALVTHTYADGNANYTITATATDEDGTFQAGNSVTVTVQNVAPTLEPISDRTIDEGTELSITDLGLISDPGFRDLLNGTDETFRYWIDWGDRVPLAPVTGDAIVDHVGGPMDATRASFDGAHTYADDGHYVVTVRIADDDMGAFNSSALFQNGTLGTDYVERQFIVHVKNVAPQVSVPNGNLTVLEGEVISLSDLATFSDPGFDNPLNPNPAMPPSITDPLSESFTYDIDWGDGRNAIVGVPIADINGMPGTPSSGVIAGAHVYADDGVYEVTITVRDDNGGVGVNTFFVTVNNVAPTLTGNLGNLEVDEGTPFVLSDLGGSTFDLGLGIVDPGFDNPLNPSGATQETFTGVSIDWGDGTASDALMVVGRTSDLTDGPTTALLQHKPHVYADDGDYVVTITLTDDDGAQLEPMQITVRVNNVAPSLTLTSDSFTVNEGEVMNIPNLGVFTDPGFTDASNLPPSTETFTYWIDWGDGTVESGLAPASVVQGSRPDMATPELTIPTMGTLADSHLYADNPTGGNQYTITVRLADDDMSGDFADGVAGVDFVEQQIVVTVLNVNPTLDPITATDVETSGRTVLDLSFVDPGADSFQVLVDWGDQLHLPADERFVVERVHVGPTPTSYTIEHFYTGPPDPLNPSADIIITVKIFDDDALFVGIVEPGISNLESVAISNPGIETTNVAIDTTPDVPKLEPLAVQPEVVLLGGQTTSIQSLQNQELRVATSDAGLTSERYLELVAISPSGEIIAQVRLPDDALNDLRELFKNLPDGHYQIVLVRTDNNSRRLVLEVYVRQGRVVDPSDDSEGTRDRPPTSETTEGAPPPQANPETAQEPSEPSAMRPPLQPNLAVESAVSEEPFIGRGSLRWRAPIAGLALAGTLAPWSRRLEAAFCLADEHRWRRLRQAGRLPSSLSPAPREARHQNPAQLQ